MKHSPKIKILNAAESARLKESWENEKKSIPDYVQLPLIRALWTRGMVYINKESEVNYDCLWKGVFPGSDVVTINFSHKKANRYKLTIYYHPSVKKQARWVTDTERIVVSKLGEVEIGDAERGKLESWERVRFV